jgi:hypothetical protein
MRLVLFGGEDDRDTSLDVVCIAGEGVNTDHLAFEDLENAGERPPLIGCDYTECPGHSGSFRREWLRAKKKPPTSMRGGCWLRLGRKVTRRHHLMWG